jgi:excisionase family DNA binding protein
MDRPQGSGQVPDEDVSAFRPGHTAPSQSVERLLTVEEVAQLLGTGVRFPRRLIAERRVRFVKVGRHVRIPASAVKELIQAGTQMPVVR